MSRPRIRNRAFIPPWKRALRVKLAKRRLILRRRHAPLNRKERRKHKYGQRGNGIKHPNLPGLTPLAVHPLPQERPSEPSTEPLIDIQKVQDAAYQAGYAEGVEETVASQLPPYTVLPDIGANEVIAAGISAYREHWLQLLRPEEVHGRMEHALAVGQPLSVVRLGDGELLALAHDTVLPLEEVRQKGRFLSTAGMQLPDPQARDMLADSLRMAGIIGIPHSRLPTFQGLLFPVLRYYGLSYRSLTLTTSTMNYALHEHGLLQQLLPGKRLLLIGNRAPELANMLLASASLTIAGVISPVRGFSDIPRVMQEAAICEFDLALVASGIPAVVICERIASQLGKVALDFGHLADKLVSGEIPYAR